jgi:4-alpha-glucanotransferase
MNTPGTSGDATTNWKWKLTPGMLTDDLKNRLSELTRATGR